MGMGRLKAYLADVLTEDADRKLEILQKYMAGIIEWNKKVNITSIDSEAEFEVRHYLDSLACMTFPEFASAGNIIDIGTGGGFPGIPLAVVMPDRHFLLADSLAKRLRIIDGLCAELNIDNAETVHGRAEDLARQKALRERFDICVSRAVAGMATLAEYCLPFVRPGGTFIAWKGPEAAEEAESAGKAIRLLGGEVVRIERAECISEFEHNMIVIRKNRRTPGRFPRKAGTPSREPLK